MSDDLTSRRELLKYSAAVTSAGVSLSGCLDSQDTLTLSATGLVGLPTGRYQVWAVLRDERVPLGYNAALVNSDRHQYTLPSSPSTVNSIEITVEEDKDTSSSGPVVMSGDVNKNGIADLSFPVDLTESSGGYTITTPTSESADDTNGVWFVENVESTPQAGLDLPTLPTGWIYEGWVKLSDRQPVSTGRFRNPTIPDYYNGFGGEQNLLSFPGEDFLNKTERAPTNVQFPIDMTEQETTVYISVEPDVGAMVGDSGGSYSAGEDIAGINSPFPIKPLHAMVPDDVTPNTFYKLNENVDELPSGTAQFDS